MAARFLTKDQLVKLLKDLAKVGWIKSLRPLNSGGIGNTIDSRLGLTENNLPIADTAQWEMKTHRAGSASLLTLFHMEPQPRGKQIVTDVLLPNYGWPDQKRVNELSFRQTLTATRATDRGFSVKIDRTKDRVLVSFDSSLVDQRHKEWLVSVKARAGLGPLRPQPFWLGKELFGKASVKLLNTFHVEVDTRRSKGEEYFRLCRLLILQGLEIERFITAIEKGNLLVDFDARSHHNHGTKFRIRQDSVPGLYRYVDKIDLTLPQHVHELRAPYEPSSGKQAQLL